MNKIVKIIIVLSVMSLNMISGICKSQDINEVNLLQGELDQLIIKSNQYPKKYRFTMDKDIIERINELEDTIDFKYDNRPLIINDRYVVKSEKGIIDVNFTLGGSYVNDLYKNELRNYNRYNKRNVVLNKTPSSGNIIIKPKKITPPKRIKRIKTKASISNLLTTKDNWYPVHLMPTGICRDYINNDSISYKDMKDWKYKIFTYYYKEGDKKSGSDRMNKKKPNTIYYSGHICQNGLDLLMRLVHKHKNIKYLYLNSKSSLAKKAHEMGKFIKEHKISTVAIPDGKCYSGCTIVFGYGEERLAKFESNSKSSNFGFHGSWCINSKFDNRACLAQKEIVVDYYKESHKAAGTYGEYAERLSTLDEKKWEYPSHNELYDNNYISNLID